MSEIDEMMSRVSGIPRTEVNAIWEQVKANHRALEACVGPHDFSVEAQRVGTLVRRWRCTKCGGEIDAVNLSWYATGLQHGRAER